MAGSSSRVNHYLQETPFTGGLPDADVIGGANVDGRAPEAIVFLKIAEGRISDAGFQSSGCGYLIACCSALLEMAVGRTIADSACLAEAQVIDYLGGLPDNKRHCAALAVLALRNALAKSASNPNGEEGSQ